MMATTRSRLLVASFAVVGVAAAAVWLTGRPQIRLSRATGPPLLVLQLNLCDSGIAGCYTGRSVRAATAVIRSRRPDIVTLDEICRGDMSPLRRAMAETDPRATLAAAFRAAEDRRTGGAFRCRDGQPYGVGILVLGPRLKSNYRTYSGTYPVQDLADPEERVWLCVHAPSQPYACATHTASTSTAVALAQCRYLLDFALPGIRTDMVAPVIVGADLNLPASSSPSPQSCLPRGYNRADDGSRQDVIASDSLVVRSRTIIDMRRTTDHPGLLVKLTRTRANQLTEPTERRSSNALSSVRGKRNCHHLGGGIERRCTGRRSSASLARSFD